MNNFGKPRSILVANWKMHKTSEESAAFIYLLRDLLKNKATRSFLVVAPAFPCIPAAIQAARSVASDLEIAIAGQNLHWESEGAFTGEVSGGMLAAAGCSYVIIGHSERRQLFGETDETVARKIKAALGAGLTPIVCVGETQEQRSAEETEIILRYQFERAFWGREAGELAQCVLAYEPVWAIGSGNTATPEMAEAAHRFLRRCATDIFGGETAARLPILYGGSIKQDNFSALQAQPDINGGLVGGASLVAADFSALATA